MQQVVDLQRDNRFDDVVVLSIAVDSPDAWAAEAQQRDIRLPLLSDPGARISSEYGVMQWAMGNEPGHTFVLVDHLGFIQWIQDYGAAENGGLMYVEPSDIYQEIAPLIS